MTADASEALPDVMHARSRWPRALASGNRCGRLLACSARFVRDAQSLFVPGSVFVAHPRCAHTVTEGRDVVFLDLLGVFPRFAASDREQHVQLTGVIHDLVVDHHDDLAEGQPLRPSAPGEAERGLGP